MDNINNYLKGTARIRLTINMFKNKNDFYNILEFLELPLCSNDIYLNVEKGTYDALTPEGMFSEISSNN